MTQPHRRRSASSGSTPGSDDDAGTENRSGGWVVLQASVRPSVRKLARSVCRGMTRATGERFTLAEFLSDAIRLHAARLADEHNHGQPWPTDDRPLPPGRPLT